MTKEDKELLLKDLCSRLPYKPRVRYYYHSIGSSAINGYSDEGHLSYQNLEDFSLYPKYGLERTRVYNILPYLRPMSSMTEEEKAEYDSFNAPTAHRKVWLNRIDWLLSKHFDLRDLIPIDLALEAPEGMYN